MDYKALLTEYADSLRAGGRSRQTIRLRLYYLKRFAPADNTVPTRQQVLAALAHPSWTNETRRSARASFASFFQWLADTHAQDALQLPRVRETPPCPRPVPEKALQDALRNADRRLTLMLRLAGEAGLRRGEIAPVNAQDLIQAADGWLLRVHGKGGKVRTIPLPAGLARDVRRACMAGGGWAFPSRTGSHISADYVGKLLSRALPAGMSGHSLRHRFATQVYANSGDLLAVQQLLGHATPTTTQRYVKVDQARLRSAARTAALG